MGIDNIDLIIPFLKFESEDDFYYLQLIQRKKDNPELGSNSRIIKNYNISSVDYLLDKYDEIKKLCEVFNARASIRLNKRSHRKVAFKTLVNISNNMSNDDYSHISKCYSRACGDGHNDKNKKWIVDLDDNPSDEIVNGIINTINQIVKETSNETDTIYSIIPTKSGKHLITKPFNLQKAKELGLECDIHKDNPTLLYYNGE